jgi:hypothetical protein
MCERSQSPLKRDVCVKRSQKEHPEEKKINGLFSNSILRKFTPEASKYATQEFKKNYGEDANFDFMNKQHRVFQGQKMAEFLRSKSDVKEVKKTSK